MDAVKLEQEKRGEYYCRLGLAILVMLLGAFIIIEPILSHNINGYQIIVGLELLGGAYFIITKKFAGFKAPTD
ncbi:MAG: hypothetical protein V1494_05715 [Candidatus Diapherotrites archaeon]